MHAVVQKGAACTSQFSLWCGPGWDITEQTSESLAVGPSGAGLSS